VWSRWGIEEREVKAAEEMFEGDSYVNSLILKIQSLGSTDL
jgi:hypothetical protein